LTYYTSEDLHFSSFTYYTPVQTFSRIWLSLEHQSICLSESVAVNLALWMYRCGVLGWSTDIICGREDKGFLGVACNVQHGGLGVRYVDCACSIHIQVHTHPQLLTRFTRAKHTLFPITWEQVSRPDDVLAAWISPFPGR